MSVSDDERSLSATARGLAPPPRFVKRCRSYEMDRVPATYEAFENEIVKWIASCVTSRTNNAHREIGLVRGNQSVREIWDQVSPGQRVVIIPDYQWGRYRVESIRFRLQGPPKSAQQPSPNAPNTAQTPQPASPVAPTRSAPRPTRSLQESALRMMTVLSPYAATNNWAKIALCVAAKYASGAKVDGRYLGYDTLISGPVAMLIWGKYPATLAEVDAATFIQRFEPSLLRYGKEREGSIPGAMRDWVLDVRRAFAHVDLQSTQGIAMSRGWATIGQWLNQRRRDASSILNCF